MTPEDSDAPAAPSTPPATTDGLQFDRAEMPAQSTLTCVACKAPIGEQYFEANGNTICPKCREQIDAMKGAGSKMSRTARAALGGIGGGIAGFLLYWIVLELTKTEWALLAIVVGWLVGGGVRWGSGGIGGRFYQLMAALITYVAICSTYVPLMMRGSDSSKAPFLLKAIVSFVFSLVIPWMEGPSNFIGWLIIGFGVYQAWKINQGAKITINGPFFTRPAAAPPA